MSEKLFEVVITGNTIPGMDKAEVVINFANLFKVDTATAEKMLGGKTRVIKKNVDHKTGFKYHQALRKAGVLAMLKPVEDDKEQALAADTSTNQTSEQKPAPVDRVSGNQIAQDKIADGSKPATSSSAGEVDKTSNLTSVSDHNQEASNDSSLLTVANAGEVIPVLKSDQAPLNPDTSSFSVAEPGSILDEIKPEQAQVNPDISHLDVAAAGEQLAESQVVEPLVLDLSALSVAEAGSELEEIKQNKTLLNPNTSNLSLE
jgi:hypothetical protein